MENSKIQAKIYDKLNIIIFTKILKNGLKVIYIKKPDFVKYSIYFGCNFGARNDKYKISDKLYKLPLGVAHFLEHQMFEMPNGINATDVFSIYGVESNAYTTFDRTMYMASGTSNFNFALNYILDFVQTPCFEVENVNTERDIIAQELAMYKDRPGNIMSEQLRKNIYGDITYANEIVGTFDSIKEINGDILSLAYSHFYHPNNMCLGIIGSFDETEVFNIVENNQNQKSFGKYLNPQTIIDKGSKHSIKKNDKIDVDIVNNSLHFAIKIKDSKISNPLVLKIKLEILNEIMFGVSSKYYQEIVDSELAELGFGAHISLDNDFNRVMFYAQTKKPNELVEYLLDKYNHINDFVQTIDEELINKINKASLGIEYRNLNDFDETISNYVEYDMDGVNYFEYLNYVVTKEDLIEVAKLYEVDDISYIIGSKNGDLK